jgi:UDP-N-acetylglucosamine 1-carboxyvinyltransferase
MQNIKIQIEGEKELVGSVRISGAKNAALPELAAAILSSEQFHFSNVPEVEDIKVMFKALQNLGAQGKLFSNQVTVKIPEIKSSLVPKEIVETSRASVLILGPLLARNGYAKVSLPGGCPIGDRKINFHLDGLERMGAEIQIQGEHIIAKAPRLKGIDFTFPAKTVTGTENLLMAAVLAEGTTILRNCALEPEISDLIDLLVKMGADIRGKNTEILEITGKTSLNGTEHQVIPDRIETGTYVILGCLMNSEILVEEAMPEHIESLLGILNHIGSNVSIIDNKIKVISNGNLKPIDVETFPFPGFPTDLQAQLTTLLTQINGVSRLKENIFNNRFRHTMELNKLGAHIEVQDNVSIIKGRSPLKGSVIKATDLRASAALVLGGLIAEGTTIVENSYQLFRGYEDMPGKLRGLGANINVIGGLSE